MTRKVYMTSPLQSAKINGMSNKIIKLKPGKEESILRHHPWVFSGAIASSPKDIEEGEEVTVVDKKEIVLGTVH